MALPERKKFDPGLPPVQAVPPAPAAPADTPDAPAPEPKRKISGAKPKTSVPAGPDPHYIRRERRKSNAVLVQFGSRMDPELRADLKRFCDENDEAITDFLDRAIRYMLKNSKERPDA